MTGRTDLHLVDEEPPTPEELAAIEAEARVLAGQARTRLDPIDHEALLALALGDDVLDEAVLEPERLEAEALRRALDGQGQHPLACLAASLRSAHGVVRSGEGPLAVLDHELLLALTLGEDAVGLESLLSERAAAVALAHRIDGGQVDESQEERNLVALATRLRAAHRPGAVDDVTNERLVRRALRGAEAPVATSPRRLMWPLASALAAVAAGVALWIAGAPDRSELARSSRAPVATEASDDGRTPAREFAQDGFGSSESPKSDLPGRSGDDGLGRAPIRAGARAASVGRPAKDSAPAPRAADARAPDPTRFAPAAEPMAGGARGPSKGSAEPMPERARAEHAEQGRKESGAHVVAPAERGDEPARVADASAVSGPFAARSTASLFDPSAPFAVKGGESGRMARIVSARSAELRANRFAAWGIR
ncbi:MAG: hypothetical protein FJ096_21405 [Deltaproteobacteria bacterium]|nr:hypothetical protein [Deltaproteobacteria bacterium]